MSRKTNRNKIKTPAHYYAGDFKTQLSIINTYFDDIQRASILAARMNESEALAFKIRLATERDNALIKLADRIERFYNVKSKYLGNGKLRYTPQEAA